MRKFTEGAAESYYDSEDEVYRSCWDTEGSLHWGLFDESSGPAASWRRRPLLPAATASSCSPCELRKPRSSVPLRTGPVSRNCNAWGQIDTILVHKKA